MLSVPSQTLAGQQTAPRLVPSENRGALRPAGILLATDSDTGQVLPAVQPPDVGLMFCLCTGRQQQQLKAVGLQGEVEFRSSSGLLVLLLQWRKAAASGRKSFEVQKASPTTPLEGFASEAAAADAL